MTVGPVTRDDATAAFFDGAAMGQFLIRRCPAGHYSDPTGQQCAECESTELSWVPATGGAKLISWAVAHGKPEADGTSARTVLVIAELDEGPWWWSQLQDADAAHLTTGMRLRIAFSRPEPEHEAVPTFVAASERSDS